jgi:hypothetical protein
MLRRDTPVTFQSKNRHDTWIKLRQKWAARLAEIGLPPAVCQTEREIREFLTTGRRDECGLDLDALPQEQFWELFQFATSVFDYDTVTFTALEQRRLRGGAGR